MDGKENDSPDNPQTAPDRHCGHSLNLAKYYSAEALMTTSALPFLPPEHWRTTFTPLARPVLGIISMSQPPAHQLYISLTRPEKHSRSRHTAEKPVSGCNANTTCPSGASSHS